MPLLAYLLARFSEPSSYAGLGALLALLGWNLPAGVLAQLVQLLATGCGLLALFLKERRLIPVVLLACAVLPALTACDAVPAVVGGLGSAYLAADRLSEAAHPFVARGCAEYDKAKAAAAEALAARTVPAAAATQVVSIESFGDAACAHSPADDPLSTAIWLGRLAGQIGTLVPPAR